MGKNGNKNGCVSLPISLAENTEGIAIAIPSVFLEFVILCYYSAYV